jgi:hypothetical protein
MSQPYTWMQRPKKVGLIHLFDTTKMVHVKNLKLISKCGGRFGKRCQQLTNRQLIFFVNDNRKGFG